MPSAIITGASSGIGLEVTRLLAGRGWSMILAARKAEALEAAAETARQNGASAVHTCPTDVGDCDEVRGLIHAARESLDSVDALINNAGYAPLVRIEETDEATLRRSFEVNAIGPGIAVIETVKVMQTQPRGGRIVNVSSIAARDPFPGFFAYAAAKCALDSYVRSIGNESQDRKVMGFTVAPGAVETPMLRASFGPEVLPPESCLSPAEVAEVIVQCAVGERDEDQGTTIWMPSG